MLYPLRIAASASCLSLLVSCIVAPTVSTSVGAAESAAPAAPKDHLLFVGLDVAVPGEGGSGPIVSVTRASAQIMVDGEIQTVTIRKLRDIHTSRTPKVSGTVLTLSEPKGTRTHSPLTSPGQEVLRQQMDMAFVQDMKMASAESAQMGAALASVPSGGGSNGPPLGQEQMQAMRSGAAAKMDATQVELSSPGFDPGGLANRASTSSAHDLYDAYLVTFTAAAPEAIDDAFAVLILEVRSPMSPHSPLQTVMFRDLPRLTPEPRKITLEQRGLPQGFAVDRVAVHIFANGRELGSNLSQQSLAVTRDEAHQFLVIRHTLDHKNEDVAATLVPDFPPAGARNHVPATELGRDVEVHVNRDGLPGNVKLDPALAPGVARQVEDLVRNARFYPALQSGKPIEGTVTLTLADLFQPAGGTTVAAGN